MDTKYGSRLTVYFENKQFAFLPPRFAERISTQQQIDELNALQQHYFVYEGCDVARHNFLKIKFIQEK